MTFIANAIKSCKEDEELRASEVVLRFIRHSFKHVDVIAKVSAVGRNFKTSTAVVDVDEF